MKTLQTTELKVLAPFTESGQHYLIGFMTCHLPIVESIILHHVLFRAATNCSAVLCQQDLVEKFLKVWEGFLCTSVG